MLINQLGIANASEFSTDEVDGICFSSRGNAVAIAWNNMRYVKIKGMWDDARRIVRDLTNILGRYQYSYIGQVHLREHYSGF